MKKKRPTYGDLEIRIAELENELRRLRGIAEPAGHLLAALRDLEAAGG